MKVRNLCVDSMCLHPKMRVERTFLWISGALGDFTLAGTGRPRPVAAPEV